MHARFRKPGRWCVVVALTIALIAVGFAHRRGPGVMPPDLAAFLAAGGQLTDLCGPVPVDADGKSVPAKCDACRLSDTFVDVSTPCVIAKQTPATRTYAFVAKRLAERRDLDPTRLPRAPPLA